MCAVALSHCLGAKVLAVANAPERLEMARTVGANAAFLARDMPSETQLRTLLGDLGADIVILTANTWDGFRVAMNLARRMGRVCILALPGRRQPLPDFNVLSPEWFHAKQLSLIASGWVTRAEGASFDIRFNLRRNLEKILSLMACRELLLEPIITHRFPARRMLEAFELAAQHSKALCGAVFDWRE
jgi:L-iditol 2-dehydrogenase